MPNECLRYSDRIETYWNILNVYLLSDFGDWTDWIDWHIGFTANIFVPVCHKPIDVTLCSYFRLYGKYIGFMLPSVLLLHDRCHYGY